MGSVKKINHNFVIGTVLVLALLMSLLALWVTVQGQTHVSSKLENFQQTIAGIKPINGKDVTVEQIAEAVANYCEQNKCHGLDGRDGRDGLRGPEGEEGTPGADGVQGLMGAIGATGATGATGPQGEQGVPGTDGRTLEQRCTVVDQHNRRIEQKYTDAETWEILYYLSNGQRCPEETS